jgi:hypothetical protein
MADLFRVAVSSVLPVLLESRSKLARTGWRYVSIDILFLIQPVCYSCRIRTCHNCFKFFGFTILNSYSCQTCIHIFFLKSDHWWLLQQGPPGGPGPQGPPGPVSSVPTLFCRCVMYCLAWDCKDDLVCVCVCVCVCLYVVCFSCDLIPTCIGSRIYVCMLWLALRLYLFFSHSCKYMYVQVNIVWLAYANVYWCTDPQACATNTRIRAHIHTHAVAGVFIRPTSMHNQFKFHIYIHTHVHTYIMFAGGCTRPAWPLGSSWGDGSTRTAWLVVFMCICMCRYGHAVICVFVYLCPIIVCMNTWWAPMCASHRCVCVCVCVHVSVSVFFSLSHPLHLQVYQALKGARMLLCTYISV